MSGAHPDDAQEYVDQDSIAKTETERIGKAAIAGQVKWWQVVDVRPASVRNSFRMTYKEYVLAGPRRGQVTVQRRTFVVQRKNHADLIESVSKPDVDGTSGTITFPRVVFATRTYLYKVPWLGTEDNLQRNGSPAPAGSELTGLCQIAIPDPAPAGLTPGVWVRTNQGWAPDTVIEPDSLSVVAECGDWIGLHLDPPA